MLVEWEHGEVTYERLSELAADDPVSCAEYGKKHGLLNLDGRNLRDLPRLQDTQQSHKKKQDMPNHSIHLISKWF